MSNPSDLIKDLLRLGLTEERITEELKELGVETTQETVNRVKTGRIKRTSFYIGDGLRRLHERMNPSP